MLKKDIKKALLETKEKKETILVEQQIIKNRIRSIFDSNSDMKYFQGLPKNKKLQYSILLMKEIQELNNLGLINEQFDFMDILKSLFGRAFGGVIETAAEPLISSILSKIGFKSDGFMKKFMISLLTSKPSDLIKAFGDCKALTKLLVESFVEANVMLLQKEVNADSFMFNTIRNTVGGVLKDTAFISSIESKIESSVCDMFSSFSDRAKTVADKLNGETSSTASTSGTQSGSGGFLSSLFGK
jgi:hypothetical protein